MTSTSCGHGTTDDLFVVHFMGETFCSMECIPDELNAAADLLTA